jgi:hypothetical protein
MRPGRAGCTGSWSTTFDRPEWHFRPARDIDHYYVAEFQVTARASLAGTYVHDSRIKNW